MTNFTRRFVLTMSCIFLLAVAGCSSKGTTNPIDEDAEGVMTAEERAAAQFISDGIVYFEFDRYDLHPDSKALLTEKAAIIKQNPALFVTIEGNCDQRGTEEYNLALGERRARAAYDFLVNLGVNPSQLGMVSFGKLHPAVLGSGEAVWAKNRRDEFKVSKPAY